MLLNIATCNLWGLPWPLSVDKTKRLRDFINLIRDYDITAVQELWLNRDIAYIKKFLPDHNVLAFTKYFNHSGLVYISKMPLFDSKYIPFAQPKEFPSKKGILISHIIIDKRKIKLVNTHIASTKKPLISKNQRSQMKTLIATLDNQPTLLFGDFNIDYYNIKLPKKYHLISFNKHPTRSHTNKYGNKRLNKYLGLDLTCDLIFANFSVKVLNKKVIYTPLVSDHYPVVTKIQI